MYTWINYHFLWVVFCKYFYVNPIWEWLRNCGVPLSWVFFIIYVVVYHNFEYILILLLIRWLVLHRSQDAAAWIWTFQSFTAPAGANPALIRSDCQNSAHRDNQSAWARTPQSCALAPPLLRKLTGAAHSLSRVLERRFDGFRLPCQFTSTGRSEVVSLKFIKLLHQIKTGCWR